jgi:hypothetical protein
MTQHYTNGPPDVVGPGEIAELFGVTPQSVSLWQRGDHFPAPDFVLRQGPIWLKSRVVLWGIETKRLKG